MQTERAQPGPVPSPWIRPCPAWAVPSRGRCVCPEARPRRCRQLCGPPERPVGPERARAQPAETGRPPCGAPCFARRAFPDAPPPPHHQQAAPVPFLCSAAAAAGGSPYLQGRFLTLAAPCLSLLIFFFPPQTVFRTRRKMSRERRVAGIKAAAGTAGMGRAQEMVCARGAWEQEAEIANPTGKIARGERKGKTAQSVSFSALFPSIGEIQNFISLNPYKHP